MKNEVELARKMDKIKGKDEIKYPAYFEVDCYDEDIDDVETLCGLLYASTYQEAMAQIEYFYGDSLDSVNKLILYDPYSLFMIPIEKKQTIKDLFESC